MAKVYEFISNGTEEVEALIPVDVLRRAGADVCIVSTTGDLEVTTAHNVRIITDALIEDFEGFDDAYLLMIPGGLPGAENLCNHPLVREAIKKQYDNGKLVSAICAGPMIFGSLGISKGKRCTCYPGFEDYLDGATYTAETRHRRWQHGDRRRPSSNIPLCLHALRTALRQDCLQVLAGRHDVHTSYGRGEKVSEAK